MRVPRRMSFRSRFDRVLEWDTTDKVILGTLIVLPFLVGYTAAAYYALAHPDLVTYVDRPFIRDVGWWQTRIIIPAWLLLLVVALALRKSQPNTPILPYALSLLYFVWFAVCSYFFGTHTAVYTGLVAVGGAGCGLLLFDKRPVLLGIASFVAIISGTTLAEQLGLLPYAPLLVESPFKNGRLATSWLLSIGSVDFVLLLVVLALLYHAIDRWRDHVVKLAHTSDQLARANEVISRYVASQLAQQILAGNHGLLEKHERRKLTLFFSDIKDFSEIADQAEPEDLSEELNEYLSEMALIGERYGGTIDKFVGDAVMIFFGAPFATDDRDHALRSVRMGLEMQERMGMLREKWVRDGVPPFDIRIGINTGQATIGNFGSKGRVDYTAIGRQVNLAARLQAHCHPGKILISHSTWTLVQHEIVCVPKGEIQVKGFHNPVRVYEVVGLKEACGQSPAPGR